MVVRYPALATALLLLRAVAAAQEEPNTLTAAEKAESWQLLFDGKTLAGWHPLPTSVKTANGDWTVDNGAIVCPGTSPGWLATAGTFSDFRLRLQFRGDEKVNSGVFLRSQEMGQPHITGYELQIWDFQPAGYNTGSLVGKVKAPVTRIRAGQWNEYDITAQGDHYVVVLNGAPLLDAHDSAHLGGLIGFQCQADNKIEFRSIRVSVLRH